MVDIILGLVILAILGAAITYIYRAKKSGVKCIGCPAAGNCASHQNVSSGCSGSCASCGGGCACDSEQTVDETVDA